MMTKRALFAAALLPLAAGGCVRTVASAATTAVTVPFKVTSRVVDVATVSPSERDAHFVRRQRKAAEREAREHRAWERRCRHDPDGCGPYPGPQAS